MRRESFEVEWLRRAFAARREQPASPLSCPAPEALWSAVQGELRPEDVRPLVAHLLGCGPCAEAWRLAREVDAHVAARPVVVVNPARPRRWWAGWGAVAAGTAAAALALAMGLQKQPAPTPGFREGRANEIRSRPESGSLPRTRCLLRWSGGPQGASYEVQVATERLTPIAEARGLSVTEYLVPPDRLALVPAGSRLLWRVEAIAPDGTRVASATFVSRLE